MKNIFSAVFTFVMANIHQENAASPIGEIVIFHVGGKECIGSCPDRLGDKERSRASAKGHTADGGDRCRIAAAGHRRTESLLDKIHERPG